VGFFFVFSGKPSHPAPSPREPMKSVMTGPDYILDIKGLSQKGAPATPANATDQPSNAAALAGRPWLAIQWKCCSTYSRVYRNAAGDAYEGRCPRCSKAVRAKVGEGGTSSRFFEAD
jgi:hypothetical protein